MSTSEPQTVLLVEDHEATRALFADELSREGFTVLTARSAEEALEVCKQYPEPIHLLIADVLLPSTGELRILRTAKTQAVQASGVDLAQRVRFKRPEARVLFISGHSDQELHRFGVFKEPWPLIRKPLHAAMLVETARQVLSTTYPPFVL